MAPEGAARRGARRRRFAERLQLVFGERSALDRRVRLDVLGAALERACRGAHERGGPSTPCGPDPREGRAIEPEEEVPHAAVQRVRVFVSGDLDLERIGWRERHAGGRVSWKLPAPLSEHPSRAHASAGDERCDACAALLDEGHQREAEDHVVLTVSGDERGVGVEQRRRAGRDRIEAMGGGVAEDERGRVVVGVGEEPKRQRRAVPGHRAQDRVGREQRLIDPRRRRDARLLARHLVEGAKRIAEGVERRPHGGATTTTPRRCIGKGESWSRADNPSMSYLTIRGRCLPQ